MLDRLSFSGVFVGGITDIVASNILGIPLLFYVLVHYALAGHGPGHLSAALTAAIHGSTWLVIAQLSLGALGSVIGGYVAAWMARKHFVLNGAFSSYLCITIGIFTWYRTPATMSAGEHLLAFVLAPAFGALGGYLRETHTRRTHSIYHAS